MRRSCNSVSPNGSDFFRGGVTKIAFDRTGLPKGQLRAYFSVFDYGVYRETQKGTFEQIFASVGAGTTADSSTSRTEFALAPMGVVVVSGGTKNRLRQSLRVDVCRRPAR